MKKIMVLLGVALLGTVGVAQAQTGFGVNAQYGLDFEDFQLGAELHIPVGAASGLSFVPNFELYLTDNPSAFSINGDLHYAFGSGYTRSFTPYVGLGLAITRVSVNDRDDTDAGLNIIGGANFRTSGSAVPFFQFEYRANDYEDLSLGGGLRWRL